MRISFNIGQRVVHDGAEYEIAAAPTGLATVLIKDIKTGTVKPVGYHEVSNIGGVAVSEQVRPIESLSAAQLKVAEHRYNAIKPILHIQGDKQAVQNVANDLKVHVSTIYRWLQAYNQFQTLAALINSEGKGGKGKHRISDKSASIIQNQIENRKTSTFKEIYREIERICKQRKYAVPSKNTVRNFFKSISDRGRVTRSRGPRAASQIFDQVGFNAPSIAPLHWCEIDHTPADIMLIDEATGEVIGKPWVTVVIDVYSRAILGFYCSFYAPGSFGTGLAIVHAMMPKEAFLSSLDLKLDLWPLWGKMANLRCDNAGEFKGNSLKWASKQYGIDFEFRVPGEPQYGAYIERWMGTFSERCKDVLGYTKMSKEMRSYFKPEKMASLTLADFRKWMTLMIIQYNNEVHSSLGVTPMQQFEFGIFNNTNGIGIPDRFTDEKRMSLDFYPPHKRTVQRQGVKIDNIIYNSDALKNFVNSREKNNGDKLGLKRKFIFKYDFRCITPIYFLNPDTNQYHEIPYAKLSGPKMSVVDLRNCIGHIKKNGKKVTEKLIFETFELQRKLTEEAKKKKKATLRAATLRTSYEQDKAKENVTTVTPQKPEPPKAVQTPFLINQSTEQQTEIKPLKVYDKRSSR